MEGTLLANLKREQLEEIEFRDIDAILPSLLGLNLVTDMECRVIVGCNQLSEKQNAVYKMIMSKTKEEVAYLTECFRTSTCHAFELSKTRKTSDCKDEEENNVSQDKPNPLLNNTVLACLFGYLPLDDIKQSRLVCLKWNSAAEIYLRERCKIHFRPDNLTPHIFMEISKYSLPDRPFSAYKFSDVDYAMCVDKIENFFDEWGKNIKEVELVALDTSHDRIYDVTSWIAKSSNLCSLKIRGATYCRGTLSSISIDNLATIKTVFLENCRILTNGERVTFLPSSNVRLTNVSFERLGNIGVILQDYCYNDFFDFSRVTNLAINNDHQIGVKFDMKGQINKNQLYLRFVELENLSQAKGEVNLLRLSGYILDERIDLKITRMIIDDSEVDLSILPQTLEILRFDRFVGEVDIIHRESFYLPNLKYLSFEAERENSGLLAFLLANLPNLTELELRDNEDESGLTLDLDCIPRNVKKLGIDGDMKIEFASGDQVLEIDTLVLQSIKQCRKLLGKIKPKVLVISYYPHKMQLDTSDIVEIILANKQIETILFGAPQWVVLHETSPFEGSTFSSYVDKKSNCYKFENEVGHAIERKEFLDFSDVANMGDEYFE